MGANAIPTGSIVAEQARFCPPLHAFRLAELGRSENNTGSRSVGDRARPVTNAYELTLGSNRQGGRLVDQWRLLKVQPFNPDLQVLTYLSQRKRRSCGSPNAAQEKW
jgi:hypothetical protein